MDIAGHHALRIDGLFHGDFAVPTGFGRIGGVERILGTRPLGRKCRCGAAGAAFRYPGCELYCTVALY